MKKIFVIIAMLMLISPAMYAQLTATECLNWTKTHLDKGDCEKAKETYALYKEKVPEGNAEIERRIANCAGGKATCTLNGHEWVDLGLPSGTKWATCNVGASKPETYGSYFAYGEKLPKSSYTKNNYKPSGADAATANWGRGWRIPSKYEFQELMDNCESTKTVQNGVEGRLFTGTNGNSIFLPAAGWRYGSEYRDSGDYGVYECYYWTSDYPIYYTTSVLPLIDKYDGLSIRPVCTVK